MKEKTKTVLFWVGFILFYAGVAVFMIFNHYDKEIFNTISGVGFIVMMLGILLILSISVSEGIAHLKQSIKKKSKKKENEEKVTKEIPKIPSKFMLQGSYKISLVKQLSGKFFDLSDNGDNVLIAISNNSKLKIGSYSDALRYILREDEYARNYYDFILDFILCDSESFRDAVKRIESGIVITLGYLDAVAAVVDNGKIIDATYFDIDDFFAKNLFLMFRKDINSSMYLSNAYIECVDSMRKDDNDDIILGSLNIEITKKNSYKRSYAYDDYYDIKK